MAVNTKDKYYTPDWLVEHTIKKAIEIIGKENITEIVEPGAGDGAFIEPLKKAFPDLKQRYYDLYPEHPEVIKYDYKKVPLSYKKGRMTIGNPPFGTSSSLWKAFCKKAATNSDYIVYISPASQYNSNYYFKEGELVYSELLNDVEYRGSEEHGGKNQKVRTCLNIYKVYDREESEDSRIKRLEQDVDIHIHHPLRDGIDNAYDFYMSIKNNCDYKLYNECPNITVVLVCKVKNKTLKNKVKLYLQSLEKSNKILSIPLLKEYLIQHLYPTREERLEQDVEMVNVKKASKKNNDFICDFYIGSWGAGVVGKIYNDIRYEDQFGVKIHNEEKRKQIEEFFYSYREKYVLTGEQYAKSVGGAWLVLPFLKSKLIELLYPTRTAPHITCVQRRKYYRDAEYKVVKSETDLWVQGNHGVEGIYTPQPYDILINFYGERLNETSGGILVRSHTQQGKEEIEKFLESETFSDFVKFQHLKYMYRINYVEMKEILIKYLYPTREERLEQDVIWKEVRTPSKKTGECRNLDFDADFYIGNWGAGPIGKITYTPIYQNSLGVKILNESLRDKIEIFFNTYREKYIDTGFQNERNIGGVWLNRTYLKNKLIETLYDDDPSFDSYDIYPEVKKPIKVERARHAISLIEPTYIEETIKELKEDKPIVHTPLF